MTVRGQVTEVVKGEPSGTVEFWLQPPGDRRRLIKSSLNVHVSVGEHLEVTGTEDPDGYLNAESIHKASLPQTPQPVLPTPPPKPGPLPPRSSPDPTRRNISIAVVCLAVLGAAVAAWVIVKEKNKHPTQASGNPHPATPKPFIRRFTITPSLASPGDTVAMGWEVSDAQELKVDPFVGQISGPTGERLIVAPKKPTLYTLTASNQRGEATRNFRLNVRAPNPTNASLGGNSSSANTHPNFAGTWQLVEYTFNGNARLLPANVPTLTVTQNGPIVTMRTTATGQLLADWQRAELGWTGPDQNLAIAADGTPTKKIFSADDGGRSHLVATEAEADVVVTHALRVEGPLLVWQSTNNFKRQLLGHARGTDTFVRRYRRIAPAQ